MGPIKYLDWENELDRYWSLDIEADDLNATVIWCAVAINAATREVVRLVGPQAVKRFIEAHPDAFWVTQNGLGFDIPTLRRLLDVSLPVDRIIDVLVLSQLYNPKLLGGHSLQAWGDRLKLPKGEWNDFSRYDPKMLEYCERDAEITLEVFLRLCRRMRAIGFSERSCELEHRVREIIVEQTAYGHNFAVDDANRLEKELREVAERLQDPIQELFPPRLVEAGRYEFRVKADGTPYASYLRHTAQYPQLTHNKRNGTYTVYEWSEFNIGSPKQRIERLLSLGFKPTKFTPRTENGGGNNPQVDEPTLIEFANECGRPEVKAIADWLVATSRANMVRNWLSSVGPDGRIHGYVNSLGASSRRMTHNSPNTANIPSNEATYGAECRDLWIPDDGQEQLGYDAKAAQMRMFGHYLGDPDTARLYIEGDPHQRNADALGIPRKPTKNVFYAFIFGAQDKKLGSTAEGRDKEFGAFIRQTLYRITPGLEDLVRECEAEYNSTPEHFMRCIDGGFVRCPAPHAAINYLIQSAEACLMKQASVFIKQRATHLDYHKIGDIHDEGQNSVNPKDSQELGAICVQAIRDAGEELGFRVPMDGDFKVGSSWRYTH